MSVTVTPGDVIDGTYVVERLLGQGGMGAVFVAREERLGRKVAIKVLLDTVAGNPEAVVRFEREARSAAALQSDHVTRVLSVGHLASGAPYIVMELLEGEDLANLLLRRGPLPAQEVVGFMLHACEALAEAHALGIVHRDLKPANLFLARRPTGAARVKVLDFGISKGATAAASQALTKTTALMGTPIYMSPEQLREVRNVDGRSDVWALGIIMYELLCGEPPFVSEALAELCVLIMTTKHPALTGRRPDVPVELEHIVNRCLEKDPANRFATAHELMNALASVSLTPAHAAPLPPRMATPRMSPRLETAAVDQARGPRGQGAMAVQGMSPGLAPPSPVAIRPPAAQSNLSAIDPRAATAPVDALGTIDPRAATAPANGLQAVHAATVDPVSSTQPWLPPKRPNVLGLVLICAATAAVGLVGIYSFVLRGPSTQSGSSAAPSNSAPSEATATPGATPASISTSGTAAAAGSSSSTTPPAVPNALKLAPLVPLSPPEGAVLPAANAANTPRPPASTPLPRGPVALPAPGLPAPGLPPPGPPPVAVLPPPAPPGAAAPPSTVHAVPSTRPTTPPTNPTSLMPGARN